MLFEPTANKHIAAQDPSIETSGFIEEDNAPVNVMLPCKRYRQGG